MTEEEMHAAALMLRAASDTRCAVPPPSSLWPDLDVPAAYAIQLYNVHAKTADGARVAGHKVGLTSVAMQQLLGVDEPDSGHLFSDMIVHSGATLRAAEFIAPRIEPEIAFLLGAPLSGPSCAVSDVLRATAHVAPALEIIDSRIQDWRISLVDTVADNASSAGVVLGTPTALSDVDIEALTVELRVEGVTVERGSSADVLGHPARAVAWLANTLHARGGVLEAGHVVMPGSCTRAVNAEPKRTIEANFDGLPPVAVRFV